MIYYFVMTHDHTPFNHDYIHHQKGMFLTYAREVVFGMQDGMVSTLGALTGIAIGSQDAFTVILAGLAIIAVESVSMSIGSYTSSLSEKNITKRMLYEEMMEIKNYPDEEKEELKGMYIDDGWPEEIATQMSEVASKDHNLMLQEMAYRELSITPEEALHPVRNGLCMFVAYIAGGIIPLLPYFFLSINDALTISIPTTLLGLFCLGAFTTKFTKQNWFKSGLHLLALASIALIAGYLVGHFAELYA